MELRRYKIVLWAMLALGISFLYLERIVFYRHLQPALNPESDSIAIPLFTEGVLLVCALFLLSGVQYLLGLKLKRKNVLSVHNAYSPGQAPLVVQGMMVLIPIGVMFLLGKLLFENFSLLKGGLFEICSILPVVLYSVLLMNYWGNGVE